MLNLIDPINGKMNIRLVAFIFKVCLITAWLCYSNAETITYRQFNRINVREDSDRINLTVDFPGMKRPIGWQCREYNLYEKYTCDYNSCYNNTSITTGQDGNISFINLRNTNETCRVWEFYDNSDNLAIFDIDYYDYYNVSETYKVINYNNGTFRVGFNVTFYNPTLVTNNSFSWRIGKTKYKCINSKCPENGTNMIIKYKYPNYTSIATNNLTDRVGSTVELTYPGNIFAIHTIKVSSRYKFFRNFTLYQNYDAVIGEEVKIQASMNYYPENMVVWKNDYGAYGCIVDCYDNDRYKVIYSWSYTSLTIYNFTEEDKYWKLCDMWNCSNVFTMNIVEESNDSILEDNLINYSNYSNSEESVYFTSLKFILAVYIITFTVFVLFV